MDTHKKQHKVALYYPGDEQIVEFTIKNTTRDIRKMVSKIKKRAPADIAFCYEAGVCGFALKRRVEALDCKCAVIALDKEVEKLAESETYKEVVGLLRCFHGIDTLTAITIITEIFDFGRFSSPGELMSYLGLTCSESSTGEKEHKGSITKAGNKRVRRLLIEAAWHYRHPYISRSKALRQRRKDQPQWVIDIADRAGQRLRKRYWYLINRGKMPCKATVAVAREKEQNN
jgi:transposase